MLTKWFDKLTIPSRVEGKSILMSTLTISIIILCGIARTYGGTIIYVDVNATGANNGTSWSDAYTNLQDALKDAYITPGECEEIRVAEGNYWPDANSAEPNGTGDQTATFQLINGVNIKGGYAGLGAPNPDERNILEYETILSGDLAENDSQLSNPRDMLNEPSRAENSYHVVTGSGVNNTAVLDGFTITGGNADGSNGGGMNNSGGSPTVKNCIFRWNSAGGCGSGGAMFNGSMNPIIANCLFKNNWAYYGGAMFSNCADATVINCTFIGNGAYSGGGMYNDNGSPKMRNCIFVNNLAHSGGGIYNVHSGQDVNIVNCTVIGNGAYSGGGIYTYAYASPVPPYYEGDAYITNCILWGNEGGQIGVYDANDINVTYSDIQGGWPGEGNINEDPMLDPNYHLTLCSSPCIDAGTNDPNGGLSPTDIDGQPRIMNGRCVGEARVDMGADEFYITDCNDWLRAHCPRPESNSIAEFYIDSLELSWTGGLYAAQHDVYFGTDFDEVNDANINTPIIYRGMTTEPDYPLADLAPDYKLTSGVTYYWRVDEVNEGTAGSPWRGDVWNFKLPDPAYLVVEPFSYVNQAALDEVWKTGYKSPLTPPGGDYNTVSGTIALGDSQLQFTYNNDAANKAPWSEAKLDYNGVTSDWLANGVFDACMIGINYDGALTNSLAPDPSYDKMYMAVEDGDGNFGLVSNPDLYAQVKQFGCLVREWKVDLDDLANPNNVNLADVNAFYLGFGLRDSWAGRTYGEPREGTVTFDNLRLYLQYFASEYGHIADLTNDGVVNLYDMNFMGEAWLMSGVTADIFPLCNSDGIVDLRDFALLANHWLEEQFGP